MTSQILRSIPTWNPTDRWLLFTRVLAIDDSLILKSKIQNQSNNKPHTNDHGTRNGIEILPRPALDQRHAPHVNPIPPARRQQRDDGIHDREGAGDIVVLAGGIEEAEGEGGEQDGDVLPFDEGA